MLGTGLARPIFRIPSREEICSETQKVFGVVPCDFQIKDVIAQLEGKQVVTISPTGSSKTLTFWMPLLFNNNGIIIVITALNILGDQNVSQLSRAGIRAVNITAETATDAVFVVSVTTFWIRIAIHNVPRKLKKENTE
jgi:superfamily II DNA helicase RecQ